MNTLYPLLQPVPKYEHHALPDWHEYSWLNRIECNAFIDQIFDQIGPPPQNTSWILSINDKGLTVPTLSAKPSASEKDIEPYLESVNNITDWSSEGLNDLFYRLKAKGYFYSTRWGLTKLYDSLKYTNNNFP